MALDAADRVAPQERARHGQLDGVVDVTGLMLDQNAWRVSAAPARWRAASRPDIERSSLVAAVADATAQCRWCSNAASCSPCSASRSARTPGWSRAAGTSRCRAAHDEALVDERCQHACRPRCRPGAAAGGAASSSKLDGKTARWRSRRRSRLVEQRIAPSMAAPSCGAGAGRGWDGGRWWAGSSSRRRSSGRLHRRPDRRRARWRAAARPSGPQSSTTRWSDGSHDAGGSSRGRVRRTARRQRGSPTGRRAQAARRRAERFPARGEHAPGAAAGEHVVDQVRGRVNHVLQLSNTISNERSERWAPRSPLDRETSPSTPSASAAVRSTSTQARHCEVDEDRGLRLTPYSRWATARATCLAHAAGTDKVTSRGSPSSAHTKSTRSPGRQLGPQRREPTGASPAVAPEPRDVTTAWRRPPRAPAGCSPPACAAATRRASPPSAPRRRAVRRSRRSSTSAAPARARPPRGGVSAPAVSRLATYGSLPNPWFPRRRTRSAPMPALHPRRTLAPIVRRGRDHADRRRLAEPPGTEPIRGVHDVHHARHAADLVLPHPGSPPTPALLEAVRNGPRPATRPATSCRPTTACSTRGCSTSSSRGSSAEPAARRRTGSTPGSPSPAPIRRPDGSWPRAPCRPRGSPSPPTRRSRRSSSPRGGRSRSSSAGQATAERNGDHFVVRDARWGYVSGSQGAVRRGHGADDPRGRHARDPHGARPRRRGHDRAELGHPRPARHREPPRGPGRHVGRAGGADVPLAGPRRRLPGHAGHRGPPHALAGLGVGRRREPRRRAPGDRGSDRVGADKLHRFDTAPVARQSTFIRAMAGLEGQVELAVAGLRHLLDACGTGPPPACRPTAAQRARLRLAAAHAVDTGAHVVREAISLVGADALHRSHPLERLARDVEMLRNHVVVSPSTASSWAPC